MPFGFIPESRSRSPGIPNLTRGMASVLKPEDLSMTQYNVLRILRGSPDGLASGEIGNRLMPE
jgi:hypothetical protein